MQEQRDRYQQQRQRQPKSTRGSAATAALDGTRTEQAQVAAAEVQQQQQEQQAPRRSWSLRKNGSRRHPTSSKQQLLPSYYELPSSNLGEVDHQWQLLRMECISQTETRRLLAFLDIAIRLSLAALVAYLVLRFKQLPDGREFFCTTLFSDVNVGVACVLLPVTWVVAVRTLYRCFDSWASGKKWSQRRRRLVILYGIQLAAATLGMTCFLITNALVVSPLPCSDRQVRSAIYWLAFLRWTCWNTTFLMITVRAHCTTIVLPSAARASKRQLILLALGFPSLLGIGARRGSRSSKSPTTPTATSGSSDNHTDPTHQPDLAPAGSEQQQPPPPKSMYRASLKKPSDMLVLDLPWLYHWPKLMLWLAFESCHATLAILEELSRQGTCHNLTDTCDLRRCPAEPRVIGLLSAEIAVSVTYFAVWVWLMLRSGRLLRSRPWQEFRVANLIFRLERRLGMWAYNLIVLATVLFWFSGLSSCSRGALQYHGLPTTEIMWYAISVIGMLMVQPQNPHQANPQLISQLQDFSWTEAELEDRIMARNAAAGGRLDKEPMFCFETAIKCFFWSCLVYEEYEGALSSPAGAAASVTEGELEKLMKGLSLYDLKVHKVVYDLDGELKVLFAWNESTVLVSFRGSTTAANWVADAMLWRSAHPGSQIQNKRAALFNSPKIHSGFLRCWQGTGLDVRVLGMLSSLVETSLVDKTKLKFIFTGHSLGGAVATLAALDLVKKYPEINALKQVSVYTYGAPRVGNHAFARRYERKIPDTWHIINDQDTVPRGGKFISAYKRNGQRVIVNQAGDLVVRPTSLESSLLQMAVGSNPLHHLLGSYQSAMTSVALGQLDRMKSLPGGAQGLVNLVKDCPIMAENMYQYGNKQNLILWIGGRVLYTLNSRAPREKLTLNRLAAEHARATTASNRNVTLHNGHQDATAVGAAGLAAAAAAARGNKQMSGWKGRRQQRLAQMQAARAAAAAAAMGDGTTGDQPLQVPDLEKGLSLGPRTSSYTRSGTLGDNRGMGNQGSQMMRGISGTLQGAVSGTLGLAAAGIGGLWQLVTQPVEDLIRTFSDDDEQQQQQQRGRALQQQQQQQPVALHMPTIQEVSGSEISSAAADSSSSSSHNSDDDTTHDIESGNSSMAAVTPHHSSAAGVASRSNSSSSSSSSSSPFALHAQQQLQSLQQQAAAQRIAGPLPGPVSKVLGVVTGVAESNSSSQQQQQQQQQQQIVNAMLPSSPFASAGFQQNGGSSSSSPFAATTVPASAASLDNATANAAAMHTSSTASLADALDRLQYEDPIAARSASLLLQPAHSAPQALLNPTAVLTGIQKDNDTESNKDNQGLTGKLEDLSEKVVEKISVKSKKGSSRVRGFMGMLGLRSAKHANAGTAADAQAADDASAAAASSSSSTKHHHNPVSAVLHPKRIFHHHRHSSSGGSSSSSADTSTASTTTAAAAAGSSDTDDALNQRHLVSLDVRRLSLAAPIPVGLHAGAAMQTQVHLPVLQEGDEGADVIHDVLAL